MTYYECKNCNYKTSRFSDIKKHLTKKKYCEAVLNIYYDCSVDTKFILSLLPHDEFGKQIINKNELKEYKNIFNDRKNLISKLNIEKCCYKCNKNYDKIQDLRDHILLECFYDNPNNDNSININNSINNDTSIQNIDNSVNINDSVINIDNSININNDNSTNIILNIDKPIISFDKDWDISNIDDIGKKLNILCSDILYSKLLQKILENKQNLNVIFDKKDNYGFVYKNDNEKYVNMKLNDIIESSMQKLHNNLLELNDSIKSHKYKNYNEYIEQTNINDEKIKKKMNEFIYKPEIKEHVSNVFSNIFHDKKDDSFDISKNIDYNINNLIGY
jgi:hypothetical protein